MGRSFKIGSRQEEVSASRFEEIPRFGLVCFGFCADKQLSVAAQAEFRVGEAVLTKLGTNSAAGSFCEILVVIIAKVIVVRTVVE